MQIFIYNSEEEKQKIISEKNAEGLILIQISNITEGNFLAFSENPIKEPTPLEEKIEQLQQDNLILMDALAVTFEEVLNLKAQLGGTP
ncbi:hypothetical protein IHV12_15275 [Fictibacillus sp. 7GRE50]|uniref:hypothetical protein n=1 Tax=Fictibacillus sp. 7GRE50 TaxID=2745878 RepID=UPI0018CF78D6|nr:hypothetical protein [Fictibacillus sp. 7GRE50]MBH0166283.1 hypothetical protein [Fictibacillus sp. 7GRE50]